MKILTKTLGLVTEPASVDSLERTLLAGFVNPDVEMPHGERKITVARLRARMAAVDAWVSTGHRISHQALAKRLEMSERYLSYQFPAQSGLYAFPPPELALSMSGASANAIEWTDVAKTVRPVFLAMDTNLQGRGLLSGLVQLHRAHPSLAETDGYFANALRNAITGKRERNTLAIVGLFTDGFRAALEDWVDCGEPSLTFVAERVEMLLVGPVQRAFEILILTSENMSSAPEMNETEIAINAKLDSLQLEAHN